MDAGPLWWLTCIGAVLTSIATGCSDSSNETASDDGPSARRDGAVASDPTTDAVAPEGGGMVCPLPDPTDEGAAVSFVDDIFPLVNENCGTYACHDSGTQNRGLHLGQSSFEDPASADTPATVYASMLDTATTAPEAQRVVPGEPSESFLMLKLDGCQNELGLYCPLGDPSRPCGGQMPGSAAPWSEERRDLFRRWILQGAPGP